MPNVLTEAAKVDCGHGGSVAIKKDPQVKLTVLGSPVLTEPALTNQLVSTCGTEITGPPPPGTPVSIKCIHCSHVDSKKSAKLTVHGSALLLDPLTGQTDGTVANVKPQELLNATGVQTKLSAE
jgi:hypothetical protein